MRVYRDGTSPRSTMAFAARSPRGCTPAPTRERLAAEIAFSRAACSRSRPIAAGPVCARRGAAADIRAGDLDLPAHVYLCPLEGADPFAGIRAALEPPGGRAGARASCRTSRASRSARERATIPPAGRGARRLPQLGRMQAGSQEQAFTGDQGWSARAPLRAAVRAARAAGLARVASRFELLVTLGRLGLLRAARRLAAPARRERPRRRDDRSARTVPPPSACSGSAIRINLERRARALAEAARGRPLEALDLALANWSARERATLGIPPAALDEQVSSARSRRSESERAAREAAGHGLALGRSRTAAPRPNRRFGAQKCRPHRGLQSVSDICSNASQESGCHFASSSPRMLSG